MLTLKYLSNKNLQQKICQSAAYQSITTSSSHQQEYSPVYNFPYIRALAIINKIKVYQTIGTCLGLPSSYALSAGDLCSPEVVAGVAALGVTGCVLLHTLGFMISNTVGIIYLHHSEAKTKVSYVDTWGSRRDTIIHLKDIVPFCDQRSAITDPLYLQLTQYANKDKLKLNVKYGQVLDAKKFETIFSKNN